MWFRKWSATRTPAAGIAANSSTRPLRFPVPAIRATGVSTPTTIVVRQPGGPAPVAAEVPSPSAGAGDATLFGVYDTSTVAPARTSARASATASPIGSTGGSRVVDVRSQVIAASVAEDDRRRGRRGQVTGS